jgi:hypothetical protein
MLNNQVGAASDLRWTPVPPVPTLRGGEEETTAILEAGTAARRLGGDVAETFRGSGSESGTLLTPLGSVRAGGDAGPRIASGQVVTAYTAALSDTAYKQSVLASIGIGQMEQDPE